MVQKSVKSSVCGLISRHYLKNSLKEIYKNAKVTPERLTGEHKIQMSSTEILNYLNQGNLAEIIIDQIFQSLENERSTITLIEKFHKKIGLKPNEELISQAIYYLEIRHKLVHTDGYADIDFIASHPTLSYTSTKYIVLNYPTVNSAKNAVTALVKDIDNKIMQAQLVPPNTAPSHLD